MSLDSQIKRVEKASDGIELRNAIIELLTELISDSEFNASDLSGYSAQEFYTKEDARVDYEAIRGALDYILVEQLDETVFSSLSKVSDYKDQIREAVNGLYGSAVIPSDGENSAFENYADYINDIPNRLNVKTVSATAVTENGTYEADEGEAYSQIVVNVPQKTLTTRAITKNGTYYAAQDGANGYEYVTVSVTGNMETYTVRFMSQDGQNVLYTARNIPYGGYAAFDGEYPTSSTSGEYFNGWNPAPENITQDTDCYPVFSDTPSSETEITDSWETIIANHGAGYPIGSYKYITFDASKIIWAPSDGVYPSWSSSSGTYSSTYGYEMKGIQPLKMIKVASGESGTSSTWVSETELKYSQRRFYTVYSSTPYSTTWDGYTVGSWSSYSGSLELPFMFNPIPTHPNTHTYADEFDDTIYGWYVSDLRQYLNTDLLDALPDIIKNAIQTVARNSSCVDKREKKVITSKLSRDKIWVPSVREFFGPDPFTNYAFYDANSDANLDRVYKQTTANNTMDYSIAWILDEIDPTYNNTKVKNGFPSYFLLRDAVYYSTSTLAYRKPGQSSDTYFTTNYKCSCTITGGGLGTFSYNTADVYVYQHAGRPNKYPFFIGFCL